MPATMKRKRTSTKTVSPAGDGVRLEGWRYLVEPLRRHGWTIPDETLSQWPAGPIRETQQFLDHLECNGWDGVKYADIPEGLQARPNQFGVMRPEQSVWVIGSIQQRPSVEIKLCLCPDNLWRHATSLQTRLAGQSGPVSEHDEPAFADRNLAIRSACADALRFARGKKEEKQIRTAIEKLIATLPPTESQQRASKRTGQPINGATGKMTSAGRAVPADQTLASGGHSPPCANGELRQIPLAAISPSPLNRSYGRDAEQSLDDLAESLKRHGQLQAIGVRVVGDQFELIWGEGRWRAATAAGLQTIDARVFHCSEAEAIALRGDENIRRRELKPLERIEWLRQMIDVAGWQQKDLARREGLSESALSNQLRVLKLPAKWLQWISQEKYGLTITHGRYLAPWVDRPQVLEFVERRVRVEEDEPFTVQQFEREVFWAVRAVTRSVTADRAENIERQDGLKVSGYVMCALTRKQLADPALDVQDIKGIGRRAWNIALWDQYQHESQTARDSRARKRSIEKAGSAGRAAPAAPQRHREQDEEHDAAIEAAEAQREASRQLKLRRYVTHWQQDQIAERLRSDDLIGDPDMTDRLLRLLLWFACNAEPRTASLRRHELLALLGLHGSDGPDRLFSAVLNLEGGCDGQHTISEAVRTLLASWIGRLSITEGPQPELSPAMVSAIAAELDVVLSRDWRCDKAFLELLNIEQLQGLLKGWELALARAPDRKSDLIAVILQLPADTLRRCPDMLLAALP